MSDDEIYERLAKLETNVDWLKRLQYVTLGTQLTMMVALITSIMVG